MGKKRLISSIAIGAAIGGIAALFDWDTRNYTKHKLSNVKDKSVEMIKNPTISVHNARIAMEEFSESLVYQAENAVNALEQVENTLTRVTSRPKRIQG
ncbi:YtxH domain-containing protein [Ornithinibacillus sp. 179-J 7C1 HS]|uniref:YtxH domain-containing protein n=1 Tax=Ornithinibacillus sp. 179-J 7C1 HS TaxID=3142384 RepID=UPI0039A370BA